MELISVFDMGDSKKDSVSELISFLKSSFQTTDFEKVERIFRLREEKMKIEKKGLEDEIKRRYSQGLKSEEMVKSEIGLEEELGVSLTKNRELFAELEKKKMELVVVGNKFRDLEFRKIALEDELKGCKRTSDGLEERIRRLEEDKKVICEREKWAEERICFLEEEIRKMESDKREKYIQFNTEIRDLECGKRRLEDEVEVWKKKFMELEMRVSKMENGNSTLRCVGSHVYGKRELEPEALRNEASYNDEEKKGEAKTSELQIENGVTTEKMLNRNEKIVASAFVGSNHPTPLRGNRDLHVSGPGHPASINMQCDFLVKNNEEKKNTPLGPKVESRNSVKKQLVFELEGTANEKIALRDLGNAQPASGGIIDISDSEDEKESSPKLKNVKGKETIRVSANNTLERSSDNEKYLTSKKCLKRPCSDQEGGESGRSCEEEKIPRSSTQKRKRASKIVTSESEGDDDDRIPIGRLKMKKLEELNEEVHKFSSVNLCARNVTQSSLGQNVEESITPSRRRLISLRQCEEKKSQAHKTSPNPLEMGGSSQQKADNPTAENGKENVAEEMGSLGQNVEESITPSRRRLISLRQCKEKKSQAHKTSPNPLEMGGNSQQKADNPTAENGKENVAEEMGSDSEGESLGGFIVEGSDSSGSGESDPEDAEDADLDFNQVLALIRRNKVKEPKWQFEADMLSAFEEDPELCMKAVCALYRQQTSEEKSVKGSLHSNNRGFNKFDALRGTIIAEFLMDGDHEGDLKKSVKELEEFDIRAPDECKRLARHYSKQLFNIYQNKEDPFFLPSSTSL